ncbi:MAG: hypothetical protein ACTSR3_17405 [Candidatus Helarchaeota archaeon]
MVQDNHSQMFKCPKCGQIGIINLVKVAGNTTIIKFKCPAHGGKVLKIPTPQIYQFHEYIRMGIFRCAKCGRKANVDQMKVSGPWTLIRMNCEVHGNKLPFQKIWGSIYHSVTKAESTVAGPLRSITTHLPSGENVKVIFDIPPFCPYCKAPLNASNVKWVSSSSVTCSYCETSVQCLERKIPK